VKNEGLGDPPDFSEIIGFHLKKKKKEIIGFLEIDLIDASSGKHIIV
jgi:hypothetical protein